MGKAETFLAVVLVATVTILVADIGSRLDSLERSRNDRIQNVINTTSVLNSSSTTIKDGFSSLLINHYDAGPDSSVHIESETTLFPCTDNLDCGQTLYPALSTDGSVQIKGRLVVDNVYFKHPFLPNLLINMQHWIATWINASAAIQPLNAACEGAVDPWTGECVCEEGWTGTNCDTSTCFEHGTLVSGEKKECICTEERWNATTYCMIPYCSGNGRRDTLTNACVCDFEWEGPNCETKKSINLCNKDKCQGTCEEDSCICNATRTGVNCEFECNSLRIDETLCPWREDWWLPMHCTHIPNTDTILCVCGGGYNFASDTLTISSMRCDSTATDIGACQTLFDAEAPICCSPGIQCDVLTRQRTEKATNAVCNPASKTTAAFCYSLGCQWCGQDELCIASDITADNCSSPYTASITGKWSSHSETCDTYTTVNLNTGSRTPTMCNRVAAETYLATYQSCYDTMPPDSLMPELSCLQWAFQTNNNHPSPQLDAFVDYGSNVVRKIADVSIQATNCAPQYVPVLSIDPSASRIARTTNPVWVCSDYSSIDTAGVRLFVSLEVSSATVGIFAYNIIVSPPHGGTFCLRRYDPSMFREDEEIQLFNGLVPSGDYFFQNLQVVPWSTSMDSREVCDSFSITNGTITAVEDGQSIQCPSPSTWPHPRAGLAGCVFSLAYFNKREHPMTLVL